MPTRAQLRTARLLRLSDAAVELFDEHGPSVTVEAIAEKAGVSRRTVFRHMGGKEELAFLHPVLWLDVFAAALEDAPAEPLSERLRVASRAIALHIDASPDRPRRAFAVAARHPELLRGFTTVFQTWIDRVATEVLTASADPDSPAERFRARIIGAAVMGMVDAVVREWVFSDPPVRFVDLYDRGFELLAPLFDS